MSNIINCGKYKNISYEEIILTNKQFCQWVVENCSSRKHKHNGFYQYLTKNDLIVFNKNQVYHKKISVTKLVLEIIKDPVLIKYINNMEYNSYKITKDSKCYGSDKYEDGKGMTPSMYGVFIDYYIRYRISKFKNIEFFDNRVSMLLENKSLLKNVELEESDKIIKYINDSYNRLKNKDECNIFTDLSNCATAHYITMGNSNQLNHINKTISLNDKIIKSVDAFINTKVTNAKNILLNPILNLPNLNGDADLIIDDVIVDIKTTNKDNVLYNLTQLLIYSVLHKHCNNKIANTIMIFNARLSMIGEVILNNNDILFMENYLYSLDLLQPIQINTKK